LTPTESDHLVVVLVSTRNPLNIGAAARAMSNFGFSKLRVVNPYEEAFRETRSAIGASEVLKAAEEFTSLADAVADCSLVVGTTAGRNRELQHRLAPLPTAANRIRTELKSGRVALLYGSEKRGLSNEDLTHCHWILRIPTEEQHPSMNLGQAVAVCLYDLARDRAEASGPRQPPRARARELENITKTMYELISASGYVKPRAGTSTNEKLRRLVRRLKLNAEDAEVVLGMLRKIEWKLKSSSHK